MATTSQRPSSLACIECRKKHLRCDALAPICSRCRDRGFHCSYTPSRRGCSGRSKRQAPQAPRSTHLSSQQPLPGSVAHTPSYDSQNASGGVANGSPAQTWTDTGFASRGESIGGSSQQASTPDSTASSRSSLRSEDEHLTNLYYANFHPSHPILAPRNRFFAQNYAEYLKSVTKFIGSHYAPSISSDTLKTAAVNALSENGSERSPEMVQALLLYSMALHARYEPMEAMSFISKAADMAIDLGLYRAEYAAAHGHGNSVLEESLRRTWWELYVTDGYLASLHRHTNFKCNTVCATVLLPCNGSVFVDGDDSVQRLSLEQFDSRLFADEGWRFSSFTYRIEAVRILARVIAVSTANETHADAIQAIDNAIASWKFDLPNEKAGIVNHAGEVDEMMFQAHIFIHCASIFLHFPRSELPITMPAAAEIACAQRHMEQVSPTSTQHAAKALAASKDLTNLAALPMEKHPSPFFICGLVFACVVQLSACSAYPRSTTTQNRDRVALMIGILKSLSRQWSLAQFVGQQLKRAANEIFYPKPADATTSSSTGESSSSSYDSGVDMTSTNHVAYTASSIPADMTWFDLFYSEGLQGFQGQMMSGGEMDGL